MSVWFTVWEKL